MLSAVRRVALRSVVNRTVTRIGGVSPSMKFSVQNEEDVFSPPFGTLAAPVRVESEYPSRVVGCVGAGAQKHDLVWFDLKSGLKHMCSRCGQMFILTKKTEFRDDNDDNYQYE